MRAALAVAGLLVVLLSGCSSPASHVTAEDVRFGGQFAAVCDDHDKAIATLFYTLHNEGPGKASKVQVSAVAHVFPNGGDVTTELPTLSSLALGSSRPYEQELVLASGCEAKIGEEQGYRITLEVDPSNGASSTASIEVICMWTHPDTVDQARCG